MGKEDGLGVWEMDEMLERMGLEKMREDRSGSGLGRAWATVTGKDGIFVFGEMYDFHEYAL
jgi:hypothetical protein